MYDQHKVTVHWLGQNSFNYEGIKYKRCPMAKLVGEVQRVILWMILAFKCSTDMDLTGLKYNFFVLYSPWQY